MGDRTAHRWAPLAVAVLVLVAVGGTWLALRGDVAGVGPGSGGSDAVSRKPLRLVGWTPADGATADPRYSLADGADLADGPGTASVRRLAPVDPSDLRAALAGLAPSLSVDASGQWTTGSTATVGCAVAPPPDSPVASDDVIAELPCTRIADTNGSSTTEVAPPVALPTRDAVLEALGLGNDQAHDSGRVEQPDGTELYSLDPRVGGLPTWGLRTTLVQDRDGARVYSGSGWLVQAGADGNYPVVSAADAFQLLRRTPLPMPLMACPEPLPEGSDPVPCGGPVTVTGADLGLSLQQSPDGYLLVPAWFFRVEGSDYPLVQVAVEPRLVQRADATSGGSSGGSSGSTGSGGVAVPPVTPSAVPPSTGPGEPVPDPQSQFTSVTRGADDRTLDVTFWGGVAGCYSYGIRTVQDDRRVRLWLMPTTPQPGKVCIDLAQERHRTVTLDAPLGLRTVEDGATGTVLLGPVR
ncbi:MAG: hypothetical protein ABI807_07440 [Sporichthyaceae bacterium]